MSLDNSQVPEFLTAGESSTTNTNSKTFAFNANHKLPLQGSGSLGYAHSSFDGSGNGTNVSGSTNDYSGSASFTPVQRLSTLFGLQYTDNLQASVEQQLAAAGSLSPQVNLGLNSHSLSFYNSDSLYIIRNLSASFNFNRFQQGDLRRERGRKPLQRHPKLPLQQTVVGLACGVRRSYRRFNRCRAPGNGASRGRQLQPPYSGMEPGSQFRLLRKTCRRCWPQPRHLAIPTRRARGAR